MTQDLEEAVDSRKDSSRDESLVDDLVAGYLDFLNSGETLDPLAILAEHPDLGPEVVDKLQAFVDLGPAELKPLGTLGDYTLRRSRPELGYASTSMTIDDQPGIGWADALIPAHT